MYLQQHQVTTEENNLLSSNELVLSKIPTIASNTTSCALKDYGENRAVDEDKVREKEKGRLQYQQEKEYKTYTRSTKDNKTETLYGTNKKEFIDENIDYKSLDLLELKRKSTVSGRKKPLILGPKPFLCSSRGLPAIRQVASVLCYEEKNKSGSRSQAQNSKHKNFVAFENNSCQKIETCESENFTTIKEVCNNTLSDFMNDSSLNCKVEMESSSIASQVTQKLFKDIMEMKSLDSISDCTGKISVTKSQQTLHSNGVNLDKNINRAVENEEEWFKNIPLPPQAFSSADIMPKTENHPNINKQSCISTKNHSSVTEQCVPRNLSSETAAEKQRNQVLQQQQTSYLPPIPLKTKQKLLHDDCKSLTHCLQNKNQLHNSVSAPANYAPNDSSSKKSNFSLETNNKSHIMGKSINQFPPKLPPKQHKLKRNSSGEYPKVSFKTEPNKRETQFLKTSSQQSNEKIKAENEKTFETVLTEKKNVLIKSESDEPIEKTSISQNNKNTVESQCVKSLNPEPINNESFRSRSLVDEPLAPILEEDSVFDSSSSTVSSLSRDFINANDNAVKEVIKNGEQEHCVNTNSLNNTIAKSATLKSVQQNRVKKVTFGKEANEDVINNKKVEQKEELKQLRKSDQSLTIHSSSNEKSEIEKPLVKNQKTLDVAPYGMVDLTKFEQMFKEESQNFTEELTPKSILSSVHEFNTTLKRKKETKTSANSDEIDLPSFPLQIENSSPNDWNKTIRRNKLKKNFSTSTFHEDQVGYDNLEKYTS